MTQREVTLEGGLPWGFRMHGGCDLKTSLKVSRVNPGSKAAQRGVREGDLITTINGQNTRKLTNNEAHSLLKNSGGTLKLGLNEDLEGSPKRRQYRTIHHETHQETIKRSSVSYSVKETIESSSRNEQSNTFGDSKNQNKGFVNGREARENGKNVSLVTNIPVSQRSTSSSSSASSNTLVPEGKTFSSDQAVVSRQSSYSNCSSIPDEGNTQRYEHTETKEMNNGQDRVSKSKRRRQRRKNNVLSRSTSQENETKVDINEVTQEIIAEEPDVIIRTPEESCSKLDVLKLKRIEHKYKVESPKELKLDQIKNKDKKLKLKSKSLDDDDYLKIQELSEASETEDFKVPASNIVISEASSEENLLDDSDSDTQRTKRSALNSISLRLNDDNEIETVSRISPEEEQQLRNFLGGLNLIDSPEESAKDLYGRVGDVDDPKTKKIQARKDLQEYFSPMAENPRFLDAISEEASDISDKESQSVKIEKNIKQVTPEKEVLRPPPIPPRRNKSKLLNKLKNQPEQTQPVLLETKIIDIQEDICNTKTIEDKVEKAEVVYINESSDSSVSNTELNEENGDGKTLNDKTSESGAKIILQDQQATEPSTNSLRNAIINTSPTDILTIEANESMTTSFSSHLLSTTKISKPEAGDVDSTNASSALLTELTPPPSPEHDKSSTNIDTDEGSVLKHILFDYTRVPNVLTQKEPGSGFKGLKKVSTSEIAQIRNDIDTRIIEVKNLTAVHIDKKSVNGKFENIEVTKIKVDEKSKNGDRHVTKEFDEINSNTDHKKNEEENKIIDENNSQSDIPKKLDENTLKHIMMVSKDSNKTDSEKLLEFQTICKINSEIKNKISKQESFGAMRSQSIDEKLKKEVERTIKDEEEEEEEEYLPTKNLVQRRVREFSGEIFNKKSIELDEDKVVTENDLNKDLEQPKTPNLVKSRVAMFSHNDDVSILKNMLLPESTKAKDIDLVSKIEKEIIFPITLEAGTETKPSDNAKEILIPIKLENDVNRINIKPEIIIPLEIETKPNNFTNSEETKHNLESKRETIIPIKTEDDVTSKVGEVEKEQNEKVIVHSVFEEKDKKQSDEEETHSKQIIIPIQIEGKKNHLKNTDEINDNLETKKEIIIPIKIENNGNIKTASIEKEGKNGNLENTEKTKNNLETHKETVIPIKIKNKENIVIQDIIKEEENKLTNKTKEHIIPINVEEFNIKSEDKTNERIILVEIPKINLEETEKRKEFIIPVVIENNHISQEVRQNYVREKVETDKKKENNKNEIIIPIQIENTKHIQEEQKSEIKNIPVIIENSGTKISVDNVKNDLNLTYKNFKEISRSLENLSMKKKVNIVDMKKEKEVNLDIKPINKGYKETSKSLDNLSIKKNHFKAETDKSEKIPETNDTLHINILSPPRRESVSSESSDESSRCTAKFNPSSSIGDIGSISKEEEIAGLKLYHEPMSLRTIVLNVLMSLPFGEEILKELADVSKTIENYTNKIPFIFNRGQTKEDNVNDVSAMPEGNRKYAGYEQFQARRKSEGDGGEIREDDVMSPNRLLTIIREEPTEANSSNEYLFDDDSQKRLRAKNLGEWLTLARNKSKSTSHLDSTHVPINSLRRAFSGADPTTPTTKRSSARRNSLPQEFYEKQLWDIMEKERDIQRQLEKLEDEKRKIQAELAPSNQRQFQVDDFVVSKKGDFAEIRDHDQKTRPASMPAFPTEFFRQQMYNEYMDKFSERQERQQHKVIKISSSNDMDQDQITSIKPKEVVHPVELEKEFMDKVKAKKLGRSRENITELSIHTNLERQSGSDADEETDEKPPVIVLDGDKVKGVDALPRHLQEFIDDLTNQTDDSIWSPGQQRHPQPQPLKEYQRTDSQDSQKQRGEPLSPVWTPRSANSSPTVERKEFRPVNFRSPILSRKNRTQSETIDTPDSTHSGPPWKLPEGSSDTAINLSSTLDRKLPTSQSSPGFGSFSTTPRLPRAQNPTITLLQKAREGQLPRGAHYIDQDRKLPNDRPPIKYPGEVLYHIKNEYTSDSETDRPKKMADLAPRKFEGIGPTTKDGMPLILRSEVKDKDQSKWYKRMYETIHKQKPHKDEFVTIKYKQKRAQYPYTSGYLSEPEPGAYDSDFTEYKYATLDRRRVPQPQPYLTSAATMPRHVPDKSFSSSDIVRNNQEKYKMQPGRIENYIPGHSSISDKEAKKWWDEVMDIFDGHLEQQNRVPTLKPRSFINQALKESGYESDSTLVFKRKEENASQLSPKEQREAYKVIQKGGDVPFHGFRRPAPERPKEPDIPPPPALPKDMGGVQSQDQESPRKYVENEVTIHYKTPVRTEVKEYVSEDELAHRQAEVMKKIYEEEKKRKYLQELQDMKSRRHTDNFIPSQKSPIPLNRYDDFDDLASPTKIPPRSAEARLLARALYNFVGHTARELTFRKGDLIYLRRQVDKNWYEGELNAMVGLFPVNYVEIVPYEGLKTTPRKAHEGQARAKYNFLAQTHLELSLAKGELVTITRKVDDNWFEGKIGGRKGIFPVSYVEVLIDPSDPPPPSTKPVASPAAHSMLLNGSAQGKESMGSHLYTPNLPNPLTVRDGGYHHAKPVQISGTGGYSTLPRPSKNSLDQTLHIETQSEPIPYKALYKYAPQNDDELELLEGDTVYVLEKCDDGWYVGSSDRTGAFGTFPGNYVEKI